MMRAAVLPPFPRSIPRLGLGLTLTALVSACGGEDGGFTALSREPVTLTTVELPDGRVNEAYAAWLDAVGPQGEMYRWRVGGALPAGLTLMPTSAPRAEIAGVPAEAGVFDLNVSVQAGVSTATRTLTLTIVPEDAEPLRVEIGDVDDAFVGEPYAIDLQAVGGSGQVMWSVVEGSVPGLAVREPERRQTQLSGMPVEIGAYAVTLRATDAFGISADVELAIEVTERLIIESRVLDPATTGLPYETSLVASGGTGRYAWSAVDPLPDGLTLFPTGTPTTALRGVPTRAAFFTFRVQVEDERGALAEGELLLRVDALGLTLVTETLPSGIATASYRAPVFAAGGTGAYAWRALSPLPAGLTLSPLGYPATELSGIPEASGTYEITVEVEDLAANTAQRTFTLEIAEPPNDLTILTLNPQSEATTCLGYEAPLEVVGGAPDYTWSLTSGALPPGIVLEPQTGPRVELSGAPTQAGTYPFELTIADARGDTRSLPVQLTVSDDPSVARHIAYNGNITAARADYYVTDICGPRPAAPTDVSPATEQTDFVGTVRPLVSPDGSKMAFVGPITPGEQMAREIGRLYVVDLTGPTPGPAVGMIPGATFRPRVSGFRWSPDSQKIAFRAQLTQQDAFELYVVDVSNPARPTAPVRVSGDLVAGGEVAIAAYVWSPDATLVAYVADQRRRGTFEAFFGLPSGSVPAHSLPPAGQEVDPRLVWRADSGGIFLRGDLDRRDEHALYHVSLSGGRAGPLTRISPAGVTGGDVAQDRFWLSPDGRWLAYVGDLNRDGAEDVYASRVVGGNQGAAMPTVVNPPFARDRIIQQVRWSPTSDALIINGDLFRRDVQELFYVSFNRGMAGGPIRLNPTLSDFSDVQGNAQTEFWSADGNWVGFLADIERDDKLELYVIDLRIPPPWRAVRVNPSTTDDDLDAFRFEFSPDGSRLAVLGDYTTEDRFELWAVDLRGPGPSAAVRVHAVLPAGSSVKNSAEDTAWKRDGSALFFRADLVNRGDNELWMVDLTREGVPPARVSPPLTGTGDVIRFGFTP